MVQVKVELSFFLVCCSRKRRGGCGHVRGGGGGGPVSHPAPHHRGVGLPEKEGGPGRRRGRLVHPHHWLSAHGHQAQQARCVGSAATQASPPQQ